MNTVVSSEAASLTPDAGGRNRTRPSSRLLDRLAILGFAIPAAAYLWFIHRYGVNVIWRDQWSDVKVIRHWHAGTLTLSTLWVPHNQNRLLFPNLLVVLLAQTTHFNLLVEMYIGALILFASIALIIWTHKRRSPSTHLIFYCPVAIVLLSFVQFENTLSGFQVCWYFVLGALAATLFLLDSPRFRWAVLTGAMVAAVVGSYSAIQGLYIWPVGLLLLYQRRRSLRYVLTWIGGAVLTATLFFYHLGKSSYGESPGSVSSVLAHPALAIKFFFLAIGDVVGAWIPWPLPWGGPTASRSVSDASLLLGVVIVVIAVWVVIKCLGRDEESPSPIGLALIAFGLLFALSIATGRSTLIGLWYAGSSRYTTFDLLVLVGSYLALLGRRTASSGADLQALSRANGMEPDRKSGAAALVRRLRREDRTTSAIVVGAVVIIMCVQAVLGLLSGLAGGRSTRQVGLATEDVIVNMDQAPGSMVYRIYFGGPNIDFVREMASVAERLRLTFLATRDGYLAHQREGLDVGVWEGGTTSPVTPWRGLRNGEVVSVDFSHFAQGSGRRLTISECNANAFADPSACKRTDTRSIVTGVDGSIHASYRVTTGTVGDGTCDEGQTCYIKVSSPHDPSLQSFAEISF